MENFSATQIAIRQLEIETKEAAELRPAEPFPESERSENKKIARVVRSEKSYWDFDQIYFPEDMYSEGFSKPGRFHKMMFQHATSAGVQVILGARKHGKTATFKKILAWLLLTNRLKFAGTLSQTLPNSRNILADIYSLIADNDRIKYDWNPEFIEANSDQFSFRVPKQKGFRRCMAFSEGRSVKGASYLFDRPKFILGDDFETRQSPLGDQQTDERIRVISEAYQSLSDDGTMIILGNNFDPRCALNRLKIYQEQGTLQDAWKVFVYPAWDGKKPLWKERYPAKSETELRKLLNPYDEAEWQGDFQQNPVPPEGVFFKRDFYQEWTSLPDDVRGVEYCDPNLAKKGKGDTTAALDFLYSGETESFYISNAVCKSFDDSNRLLDAVFSIKAAQPGKIYCIGFDGNVSQESTWTQHVRNYCRDKEIPTFPIEYKRYHVNELAKNAQILFNAGRIYFPPNFAQTPDGKRFLEQLFAFKGKKNNSADDAPDALICAVELITERGLVRKSKGLPFPLLARL